MVHRQTAEGRENAEQGHKREANMGPSLTVSLMRPSTQQSKDLINEIESHVASIEPAMFVQILEK